MSDSPNDKKMEIFLLSSQKHSVLREGYKITEGKKRDKIDICADILYAALKNTRKTHIISKANLNAKLLKKYLPKLIERGLISKTKEPFTSLYLYRTTPKGENFLHQINNLIRAIEDEEK